MEDTSADQLVDEAIKLRDRGRESEALEILVEIVQEHPDSYAAHVILGGLHWDREDLEEARRCFAKAVSIRPDLEMASLGLFHTSYKLGDKRAAIAEMQRFVSISDSAEYRELAEELEKLGDLGDATR